MRRIGGMGKKVGRRCTNLSELIASRCRGGCGEGTPGIRMGRSCGESWRKEGYSGEAWQ